MRPPPPARGRRMKREAPLGEPGRRGGNASCSSRPDRLTERIYPLKLKSTVFPSLPVIVTFWVCVPYFSCHASMT